MQKSEQIGTRRGNVKTWDWVSSGRSCHWRHSTGSGPLACVVCCAFMYLLLNESSRDKQGAALVVLLVTFL